MLAAGEGRGRTGPDILYSGSDPRCFCAEIDTYWVQYGGDARAVWIRGLSRRIPVVHLMKDMMVREHEYLMAEVGEGHLDWPEILEACRQAGVVRDVVEQGVCQGDSFESLAISRENLHWMGMEQWKESSMSRPSGSGCLCKRSQKEASADRVVSPGHLMGRTFWPCCP